MTTANDTKCFNICISDAQRQLLQMSLEFMLKYDGQRLPDGVTHTLEDWAKEEVIAMADMLDPCSIAEQLESTGVNSFIV